MFSHDEAQFFLAMEYFTIPGSTSETVTVSGDGTLLLT